MLNYEKVNTRFKKAKQDKALWEDHIRDCYRFAMPERNTIDKWSKGARKREFIYDDTAVDALEDYADKQVAMLVPPSTQWMKMEAGTDIPKEDKEKIDKLLEEATDVVFSHLNSSNFTSQIHDSFLDLGISTGALIIEEGDGIQSSLNFRAISLSELYLEQSSRGMIDTAWREFKIPAKDIEETWKGIKLTEDLSKIIGDKPTQDINLIEGVVKEDSKYYSVVMYPKEKIFIMEEALEYNPYIIFRESTIPSETLGRGRVMRQLNNIRTLNKMTEDYLRGLAFQANPIFTAENDGVINPYTIQLQPGVVMPVGSNDRQRPTLSPLPMSGNPQLLEYATARLQDTIRRALLSKPFGNVEQTPVRSATEMSMRNAEAAQSSLSASARIQVELLERVIATSVQILKKAGKLPEFKVNGKEVKLKFVNPSTRSQDEATLAAYGRFEEMMAGFPPDVVAQKVKIEDIPVEILNTLGLPKKLERSEEETQQIAQHQQQLAQQGQPNGGQ